MTGWFVAIRVERADRRGNRDADWRQERPGNRRAHLRRRALQSSVGAGATHTLDGGLATGKVVSKVVTRRGTFQEVSASNQRAALMRTTLQINGLDALQSNKPQRPETGWTFLLSRGSRVRVAAGAPFSFPHHAEIGRPRRAAGAASER